MALLRLKTSTIVQLIPALLFFLSTNAFSAGWKLFWSDEFDSTALREGNWSVEQISNPPNGEQEKYTAGHDQAGSNVFVKNGCLILEARNAGGIISGRIKSSGKKTFMYGRLEASMRLPLTQGMWPAFWMMGATGGGWPACGEIDIMEGKGRLPQWTSGAFHSSQGNPVVAGNYTMPTGNVHDQFHTYAIEWTTDSIQWFFEKVNFLTLRKSQHAGIPLDRAYFFILNLAVGGGFDGNVDNTTVFPESLIVDYVRVYNWDPNVEATLPTGRQAPSPASLKISGGSVFVVLPSCQTYYFELVSLEGKKVLSGSGNASSFRIDSRILSPGAYCAIVRGAFGMIKDRIVVSR